MDTKPVADVEVGDLVHWSGAAGDLAIVTAIDPERDSDSGTRTVRPIHIAWLGSLEDSIGVRYETVLAWESHVPMYLADLGV